MAQSEKKVAIVAAPFTSSWMPAMGASQLKACLEANRHGCTVLYGAAWFFEYFGADQPVADATFDYNLLASYADLGNIFFAPVLRPELREAIHDTILGMQPLQTPNVALARFRDALARCAERALNSEAFLDWVAAKPIWEGYDVIGFSSSFSQNVAALGLAERLKAAQPERPVVFGGANCSGDMGAAILDYFPQVDAVVEGEADEGIVPLVTALRHPARAGLDQVPGLRYRAADGTLRRGPPASMVSALDKIPAADFTDYFAQMPKRVIDFYRNRNELAVPIETSRGCWWGAIKHCVFCGLNSANMSFRAKSPEKARQEILEATARHDTNYAFLVDNIMDSKYVSKLLPQLKGCDLKIFYETKSNLTRGDMQALADAGVRYIQPGIESLSTEILKLMDKGVPAFRNIETLKHASACGVDLSWLLLYGFSHEPVSEYHKMIALVPRLVHLPPPKAANRVIMDRFSPYFERPEVFGLRNVRPKASTQLYYGHLPSGARRRLSYHFDFDLPQEEPMLYEEDLIGAVGDWILRAKAGARLVHHITDNAVLIEDRGRASGDAAYLLVGVAAEVFKRMAERGIPRETLRKSAAEDIFLSQLLPQAAVDAGLLARASDIGAVRLNSPTDGASLDAFLAELDALWLTVTLDNRVLALSVEAAGADAIVTEREAQAHA